MEQNTHRGISAQLCGAPRRLGEGSALVELETNDAMRCDEQALVHGGFVFGLADYAAMLAINQPTVVLGSADTRFVAPVRVGEKLLAEAKLVRVEGKKSIVEVTVTRDAQAVMSGTFVCFVPTHHVLATAQKAGA